MRLRCRDDEGYTIALVAMFLTPLLILTAIVVDLGMARVTKGNLKTTVDLAAVAAGFFLAGDGSASPVSNPQLACSGAFASLKGNLKDLPSTATLSPACNSLFPANSAYCSDGATPKKSAVSTAGPYVVTIEYPIYAADIADPLLNGGVGADDGTVACVRMRVTVRRHNTPVFGGIIGNEGQVLQASSVVKAGMSPNGIAVPALLLLERVNCGSLQASGQGGIRVKAPVTSGAWIHTDTAAGGAGITGSNCQGGVSCTANNYSLIGTALPAASGGGPSIVAENNASTGIIGKIGTFARYAANNGAGGCTYPGGLNQQVTGDPLVSRTPVDLRYNSQYSTNGMTIASLHSTARNATTSGPPAGYSVIAGDACIKDNTVWQATNMYVNCPTASGFSAKNVVFRAERVIFTGSVNVAGGYVAFPNAKSIYVRGCGACAQAVAVTANGFMSVNSGERINGKWDLTATLTAAGDGVDNSAPANWPTVDCATERSNATNPNSTIMATLGGQLKVHNSTANWCQTFIYLGDNTSTYTQASITTGGNCTPTLPCPATSPPTGPTFEINSGSSPKVSWSAPNQTVTGPSPTSPFEILALWTEGGGTSCSVAGQGAFSGTGVFFYPNCNLNYAGQADATVPLAAQFIGRTLTMSGQGVLVIHPNPKQSVAVAAPGNVQLIR